MPDSRVAVLTRLERKVFRFAYWIIGLGPHRYMSTYCQHDQCQTCRDFCKTCGAHCICDCHD